MLIATLGTKLIFTCAVCCAAVYALFATISDPESEKEKD